MGQYMRHEQKHAEAGRWGKSLYQWHILEWVESGDGGPTDGASLCDRYLEPPYLVEPPPNAVSVCVKCRRLSP